jgi:hypothetical protein
MDCVRGGHLLLVDTASHYDVNGFQLEQRLGTAPAVLPQLI